MEAEEATQDGEREVRRNLICRDDDGETAVSEFSLI